MTDQSQLDSITRGTVEIINPQDLKTRWLESRKSAKPLIIKAGFDPTAADIHLGHYVLLRKLRQFQDFGHKIVFLIGDFTAQIGDPTGRDQMRVRMSKEDITSHAQTYQRQVFKILDEKKTKVVFNSHWLASLTAQQMLELTACSTVAQMLVRADFKKRFESGREISLLEFVYPLLQGYDSVHLQADVELGGSDQKFNLLMGRQLQEHYGQKPQVVIMTPLLEGLDGQKKMSKSLGNTIGINESAADILGKIMSISDELMLRYYEILTDRSLNDIRALHPKEAKMQLAVEIASRFSSPEKAQDARQEFERVFSRGDIPEKLEEYFLDDKEETVLCVLVASKLVTSKSEARRLLTQGAVSLDETKIFDENFSVKPGVLKVGKRRFLRLCARVTPKSKTQKKSS